MNIKMRASDAVPSRPNGQSTAPEAAQSSPRGRPSPRAAQAQAEGQAQAGQGTSAPEARPAAAELDVDRFDPLGTSPLDRPLANDRTPGDLRGHSVVTDWSALKPYEVSKIVKPRTEADIRNALAEARKHGLSVSIAGARHSQGGQAMRDKALFLDMTEFKGARFDPATQAVTVRTGSSWLDLQMYLDKLGRAVKVKQASSPFTVGGSISVNCHGEDPRFGTIGSTVRSMRVMLADGSLQRCSRTENPELFKHVLGGYGLFGIVLDAELDTCENRLYSQKFQPVDIGEVPDVFGAEVESNPNKQLFLSELSIDPDKLLEDAVIWTCEVSGKHQPLPPLKAPDDSRSHVLLSKIPYIAAIHSTPGKKVLWAMERNLQPYVNKETLSRNEAMVMDYEFSRIPARSHSQVIQEYFIPRGRYLDFVHKLKTLAKRNQTNVVYASTRFIKADKDSALPYAKEDCLSVVLFRDQKTTAEDQVRMDAFAREAAEAALENNGTFYLCYQLPFTKEQVFRAYPEIDAFFEAKRRYDPEGVFLNSLYQDYALGPKPTLTRPAVVGAAAGAGSTPSAGAGPSGGPGAPGVNGAASVGAVRDAKPPFKNIEHVVVLMLENRSFDNMMGFFKDQRPEIDGLVGTENVPVDPADPSKGRMYVRRGGRDFGDVNPGHEPENVALQMYGTTKPPAGVEPNMEGFFADYLAQQDPKTTPAERFENAKHVMDGFTEDQLPVLSTLAKNFVVCDRFFSSVPTSTFPNRVFLQSGTSNGQLHSAANIKSKEFWQALFGNVYEGNTIYDQLASNDKPWKIYHSDIGWSFMLPSVRRNADKLVPIDQFKRDVQKGSLPAFSLIEPAYLNTMTHKANDQDAPHDVREGERLIADVYNTLRAKEDVWNKTLLVVVYDEHGGYYDHVPPPKTVSPDGLESSEPPFKFDRLGVRVPAILVSPWLPKGAVDHTVYDHTSILKFTERLFDLPSLTARDAAANSFEDQFREDAPRKDTPKVLVPPARGPEKNTDSRLYGPGEPPGPIASAGVGAFHVIRQAYAAGNALQRAGRGVYDAGASVMGMLEDLTTTR